MQHSSSLAGRSLEVRLAPERPQRCRLEHPISMRLSAADLSLEYAIMPFTSRSPHMQSLADSRSAPLALHAVQEAASRHSTMPG